VKKNSTLIAAFTYDGDGNRVKSVIGTETTLFIGAHYEVTNPGWDRQSPNIMAPLAPPERSGSPCANV
jgi:hypothetical protein